MRVKSTVPFSMFAIVLSVAVVARAQGVAAVSGAPQTDHAHTGSPPYDGPPLTLAGAVGEALANNPTLAVATLESAAARERRAQERSLAPPQVEAEIWQWPLTTVNPLDTNMYMFTMRQELPGRGKRAARAALVDTDIAAASNEVAMHGRDVVNRVTQAYADLFVSRQAVAVHQASVALLRQGADLTTVRYAAGRGAQQDVLRTVTEIARLHGDLVMLEARAQLAAVRLNALMNRAPGASIGELAAAPEDQPLPPVDALQKMALMQHPAVRAARIATQRAEAALTVADSDYKPDYVVGGGYQLMPRSAGAWTASVGVTWPAAPWSRGRLDALKAQAIADVATAKAQEQVAALAVSTAVHEAFIRATAAARRAELLRTAVIPQTEQGFDAARIAYEADRGEAAALIENQRMLLDAQLTYYQALSEARMARAELESAVGVDLESVQ